MWRNTIDGCLLIAILYVGGLVFREHVAMIPVRKDLERLTSMLGELPIEDPEKAYIKALPCDRPFEYMWRVYLPGGSNLSYSATYGHVGSAASTRTGPRKPDREFVLRARIGIDSENGSFQMFGDGSGMSSGMERLPEFAEQLARLAADPKFAVVKQAGAGGVVEFTQKDKLNLLSISVPVSGTDSLKDIVSVTISTGDLINLSLHP